MERDSFVQRRLPVIKVTTSDVSNVEYDQYVSAENVKSLHCPLVADSRLGFQMAIG